jgi:hypothetical protein
MDDVQLVRELGRDSPLPTADALAPARDRLSAAMTAERTGGTHPGRRVRRNRPLRRLALAGWATAGVAAAVAAVLVLAPDKIGGQVPAANADAALVLHHAAVAALTLPDIEPRPDQFVYHKYADGSESWLSADGTHDSLTQGPGGADKHMLYGCRNGQRPVEKGDRVIGAEPCTPDPAYLPDLPTNADDMLAYLNRHHSGRTGDANAMGKDILELIGWHYLRPQARAALFEAAGRIPGLRVVRPATDGGGRTGIGIAWSSQGKGGLIVFDANSYALLGAGPDPRSMDAVLQVAIVDRVGQRP